MWMETSSCLWSIGKAVLRKNINNFRHSPYLPLHTNETKIRSRSISNSDHSNKDSPTVFLCQKCRSRFDKEHKLPEEEQKSLGLTNFRVSRRLRQFLRQTVGEGGGALANHDLSAVQGILGVLVKQPMRWWSRCSALNRRRVAIQCTMTAAKKCVLSHYCVNCEYSKTCLKRPPV